MDNQDFDFLISKYSNDLMELKEKWSKWGFITEAKFPQQEESENFAEEKDDEPTALNAEEKAEEAQISDEAASLSEGAEADTSEYPKAEPESYATFTARAFTGDEAFPVEGAKIMLYRENHLHTFLITNESGETATVKIEAAPAENALIPNSENQETVYSADVFADGFVPRKGLLVSAVGDSHILLTVQLTPLPERID